MSWQKKPKSATYQTDLPDAAVHFDADAFDQLIRDHGVTFVHFRAMRCPVGLAERYDIRRPHEDHVGCSNGYLYTQAGSVTCIFSGNSTRAEVQETGVLDGSSVSVTLPPAYDGTDELVYVAPFDRLYMAEEDITVVHWQLFEASDAGREKLSFPVVEVHDLVDSRGERYTRGDFEVEKGRVVWTGPHRPGMDPATGKGLVCGIRYTYRPYWYVKQLVHEVRVAQTINPATGERVLRRMPQHAVLQREYVFEKEDRDAQAKEPESPRQVQPPANSPWAGLR